MYGTRVLLIHPVILSALSLCVTTSALAEGEVNEGGFTGVRKECPSKIDCQEASYTDGKLDGHFRRYGADGKLALMATYRSGLLMNIHNVGEQDGQSWHEGKWVQEGEGGLSKIYAKDFNRFSNMLYSSINELIDHFEASKEQVGNGPFTVAYEDGKVKFEGTALSTRPDGQVRVYDKAGGRLAEISWQRGNPNGSFKIYGPVIINGAMEDGRIHSGVFAFETNGKFRSEGNYMNGIPIMGYNIVSKDEPTVMFLPGAGFVAGTVDAENPGLIRLDKKEAERLMQQSPHDQ